MFSHTSAIVVVFMCKYCVSCCHYMLLSSCVYAVYVSVIVCNVAVSECHPTVVKCCNVTAHPIVVKCCNVAASKCHPAVLKCCNAAAAAMCAIVVYMSVIVCNVAASKCHYHCVAAAVCKCCYCSATGHGLLFHRLLKMVPVPQLASFNGYCKIL